MKWGVIYPISGVHECPFGKKQAEMIWFLALQNGISAHVVVNHGDGQWRKVFE
ncbi:hypothetical protein SEA_STEPHIG9_68 [Mycobacterium phage Stephig9]|uniref:Uncharacterized protein n=1 Tax=Mycobacterium phage Stephig9 TaxID=2591224 RepID=A0A514DHE4_9CAUD|nr:hypothetical protein SEA_STEPHIG9_68 [Mycobacterium phage Stephig9]